MRKLLLLFSLCLAFFTGCAPVAFAQASPYNLFIFKAQSFTATGQTGTAIQLNGLVLPSTVGSSYASGTIALTGTAITTVSFHVMGSSDNGATYYALPIFTVASPSTAPVTTVTATAAGQYQFSLAGMSHIKLVTTGTFTATSVTLTLTASPNASISRNNGSGGGGASATLENVYSAPGSFTFAHSLNSTFYQLHCVTRSGGGYASATYSDFPVDANDATVSVPSAGDYICSFSSVNALAPTFSVATTPSTLLYEPTMTGTQGPTFTVNQTGIGSYSGTATYSTSGLASGMTGAFSPTTITGTGSNTLTLSFPFSQTPATTSFTVSGNDGTNTHTANPSITVGNINSGLVECWPMNDGSGTTLADGCGTGNTQTLVTGSLTWQANAGLPGTTALLSSTAYLSGTNQTATNFNGSTPFSVSTWVILSGTGNTRAVMSTVDVSNNSIGWALNLNLQATNSWDVGVQLINNYPSNAIDISCTNQFISSGTAHYIAVTYDGSKTAAGIIPYVDSVPCTKGINFDTLTGSIANTIPLTIGAVPNGILPLDGVEAYTRIYNRVLSQTDITNYFNAGAR
jgi:hypothetical protein